MTQIVLLYASEQSQPNTFHTISERTQGCPVAPPEVIYGFFSAPGELVANESPGLIGTVDLIPTGYKILYNEHRKHTELVITLDPIKCRRENVIDFVKFDKDFTPYFVPLFEPWVTRSMRSFSMSVTSSLLSDAPVLTFDMVLSEDPEIIATYNEHIKTFE
jgi:hypothetical protein